MSTGGAALLLPRRAHAGPLRQVVRRLLYALLCLVATVAIVYADRGGYHDNADGAVSLVDSVYYATVTLSTTGYGDIVPYSTGARLSNVLLVTPLRVLFLIILVGTTLEVLTERTREQYRQQRWRSTVRDHTVIVGYGTKGRSAAKTLVGHGIRAEQIVVVDPDPKAVEAAAAGFAGVTGDATRNDVLLRAETQRAKDVVIATQRDDTAVLVTLTARQLNKQCDGRRLRTGGGERAVAAAVRRELRHHQLEFGGPHPRHVDAQPQRWAGDGGPDHVRQWA